MIAWLARILRAVFTIPAHDCPHHDPQCSETALCERCVEDWMGMQW